MLELAMLIYVYVFTFWNLILIDNMSKTDRYLKTV